MNEMDPAMTLRRKVVAELHARPFPSVTPPSIAHFLALRPRVGAPGAADPGALLATLLERHKIGGPAFPPDGALPGQWFGQVGPHALRWERHTEFTTFLAWSGEAGSPFDPDWLAASGAEVIAALRLRITRQDDDAEIVADSRQAFRIDTLAVSRLLEDEIVVAGDFQLDHEGQMRFDIFARSGTGEQRIGRVVQRICEIETYRAMATLGFLEAQSLTGELNAIEAEIGAISTAMVARETAPEGALDALLAIAGRIEHLLARSDYRLAATKAYDSIVADRIQVLRETRFEGWQTFAEFMSRRFAPAMRTVASTERRLQKLSQRAGRIGELLRTQVEVERSSENRALLASMDKRSRQALQLQHTVEGLSVVAISYYATALLLYVVEPFTYGFGIPKSWTAAALAPLVVALSWVLLRRIRRTMH